MSFFRKFNFLVSILEILKETYYMNIIMRTWVEIVESKGSSGKPCHEHQTLFKFPMLESWSKGDMVRNKPEFPGPFSVDSL